MSSKKGITGKQLEKKKTTDNISQSIKTVAIGSQPIKTTDNINQPIKTADIVDQPIKTTDNVNQPIKTAAISSQFVKTAAIGRQPIRTTVNISQLSEIAKPLQYSYIIIGSNYNIADDTYNVVLVEGAVGSLTVTLPPSVNVLDGFFIYISNQTLFSVTINAAVGDSIIGGSYALANNTTVEFIVNYAAKNWATVSSTSSSPVPPPTPIVLSQQIFVDKSGSDITGVGTINAPFLTIGAAMASITDSSIITVVNVGVGTFTEDVTYKDNVIVKGVTSDASTIVGSFTRDPAWVDFGRIEFDDIAFFPIAPTITMDFTNFSFTTITINNCAFGSLTILGGNTGFNPYLYITNSYTNDITLNGVNAQYIQEVDLGGIFTYNCLGSPDALNFRNLNPQVDLVLNNTFGVSPAVSIVDQCFTAIITTGNFALSGTNAALVNMTLSGGTVLTRYTDAFGLSYTNTYYIGVNNVKAALDYLASSALSYSTITAYVGGGQVGATPVTTQSTIVNVGNNNDSVILPASAGVLGQSFYIRNNSATKTLDIYPAVGEQINNAGINVPFILSPGVNIQFKCMSLGNNYSF